MREAVYLETTVLSYCTSRASRDVVVAGRQQCTQEWWANDRHRFDLFVSALVAEEAQKGDPEAVAKRMAAIDGIAMLEVADMDTDLAKQLVEAGAVPKEFPEDALHIALAAVNGIDYLLTWYFKHINNAQRRNAITRVVNERGYECPTICTPEELTGDNYAQ